jgi:hypothetical protein
VTPQSSFMIVAAVAPARVPALRETLRRMTAKPGFADPANALLPFGRFDRLHVARFVVLDDATIGDIAAHGVTPATPPTYLAFLGDCDGSAEELLEAFAARAGAGLREVFAHCDGFDAGGDLLAWMRARSVAPATWYQNWRGRTVVQVREEAALAARLRTALAARPELAGAPAGEAHRALVAAVAATGPTLTPPAPTPLGWRIADLVDLVVGIAIALVAIALPIWLLVRHPWVLLALVAVLALGLAYLRHRETVDPEVLPRPDPAHLRRLSEIEDHDVSNQFSALGSLKPGFFRRALAVVILRVAQWFTRHVYVRGKLTRVGTIHFARWVFLDGRRRLFFASNYDGSLDAYMDDFINKVGFGLNLVFSNGVGYPRARFLILGGASDEQGFRYYIRRHQLPTEVWYKAYPGLTNADIWRHSRLREGYERGALSDTEARAWLALI